MKAHFGYITALAGSLPGVALPACHDSDMREPLTEDNSHPIPGTSGTVNPNDITGPAVPGNVQASGRYGTFNPDATIEELEPGDMDLAPEGSAALNGYQQGTNPYDVNPYLNPNDLTGTEPPQRYGTFNPDATIDELEPGNADWMSGGSSTGAPSAIAPNGADVSRSPASQAARAGTPAYGSDVSRSATTQSARSGNIPSGADVSRTSATGAARSGATSSTSGTAPTGTAPAGSMTTTGSAGSVAR